MTASAYCSACQDVLDFLSGGGDAGLEEIEVGPAGGVTVRGFEINNVGAC